MWLLAVKARGVDGSLGQRAAAAQAQSGERVPAPAAVARGALAIGHGDRTELSPQDALAVAAKATPSAASAADARDPSGHAIGDKVSVAADDYGKSILTFLNSTPKETTSSTIQPQSINRLDNNRQILRRPISKRPTLSKIANNIPDETQAGL